MPEEQSVGSKLKKKSKKRKKQEKFIRTRMWFYTITSMLFNDRGTIPPNIGNNVMITNNLYITKNSLSALITIPEFSDEMPLAWTTDMLSSVKDKVPGATVDFVLKNKRYWMDRNDKGLESRINTWMATVQNPYASTRNAKRAARLLHAVDVLSERVKAYHTRTYVVVRAPDGLMLGKAIDEACTYLDKHGCIYRCIKSNMQTHLEYMSMISDKSNKKMKDVAYTLQTSETLSESLPSVQGMNDVKGTLIGLNKKNYAPYYINFRASSNAKNIAIEGASGFGKTFLAQAILLDFYAQQFGLLIMDIKGNEFLALIRACGGIIVDLSFSSTVYVNTFVWRVEDVQHLDIVQYADKMINLSKQMLMILCNFSEQDDVASCESLIDSFLRALYSMIGVLVENPNTWDRTKQLDPFVVFEYFERWLSYEIRSKYGHVAVKALDRLRIYMSRSGSNSHMFRTPIDYNDILNSPGLLFNFGLIENTNMTDSVPFKLKFFFTRILSDEYGAYRKRNGLWTVEVLEESQIVDNSVMEMYTKTMTLGRAQNKINILLGNSLSALANNPVAAPMLENISIYILGKLNNSNIKWAVKEFNLRDDDEDALRRVAIDPEFEYTFLLINQMQKNSTTAWIQAFVPDRVRNGKLFKVVDTVDE